jgi:hypothetical protein
VKSAASANHVRCEDPLRDLDAKSLADGSIDREKQDSLYVRVGCDGNILITPACVQLEGARDAIGRARRFWAAHE